MKCKDCVYWPKDNKGGNNDWIFARVDGVCSELSNNILDLRKCHYKPHPAET